METEYEIELSILREKLDEIDDELIVLLLKRFEITSQVGILKASNRKEIIDLAREALILSKVKDKIERQSARTQIDASEYILEIYKEIMMQSKKQQRLE